MSRTKEDLVNYRIERAYKTLSEAQTLAASVIGTPLRIGCTTPAFTLCWHS